MILNRQRAVRVARRPLESFLRRVANELDIRDSHVTVCFVSDREIAHMNEAFRKEKDLQRGRREHRRQGGEPRKARIAAGGEIFGGYCYCAGDGERLREKEWA